MTDERIDIGAGAESKSEGLRRSAEGRTKVNVAFGIYDNKNLSGRNRMQWEEIISGVQLAYTGLTGAFQVGEEIRGNGVALPSATVDADTGAILTVSGTHNDFTVGEIITGQTSGATATIATTDTGSRIYHDYNRSSVVLEVGEGVNDYAIRQTHRYIPYVPGKTQTPDLTFTMGAAETNRIRRVGVFDDSDGIFLEQTAADVSLVLRTSTSGAPSDANRVPQSQWNIDRLDGGASGGPNPTGATLDLSQSQFLSCPFLWQGVGPVVAALMIDNKVVPVHEFVTANESPVPYMRTPSLPVRYEIRNVGAVTGKATLHEICTSIISDGGYSLPGYEFSASNEITPVSVDSLTDNPVLAIRLKNTINGKPNRRLVRFLNTSALVSVNDALIKINHVHAPLDVPAAGWQSVADESAVEYHVGALTGIIPRPAHTIEPVYAATGPANKPAESGVSGEFINQHNFLSQNYDSSGSEMFIITGRAFTGSADILSHISWIEFE